MIKNTLFSCISIITLYNCSHFPSALPSSVSNIDFKVDQIERLSIISENYSVIRNRALGLPEENHEAQNELYKITNNLIKEYFSQYKIEVIKIPDSLKTKKEWYLIEDNIRFVIQEAGQQIRERSQIVNSDITIDLSKFSDIGKTPYMLFIKIGGWNSTSITFH